MKASLTSQTGFQEVLSRNKDRGACFPLSWPSWAAKRSPISAGAVDANVANVEATKQTSALLAQVN